MPRNFEHWSREKVAFELPNNIDLELLEHANGRSSAGIVCMQNNRWICDPLRSEGWKISQLVSERYHIRDEHVSSCVTWWVASFVRDGLRIVSHLCETSLRSNSLFASMFDGLVAFAVDRWHHDCGARRLSVHITSRSPMKEGRFVLGTFRSKQNASTLPIKPKRSSSRDVGTSS
ncbi:hypothetical protein TNCV_79441 [Trichonephila clavipes]|nr:hypothetical protein TNCV_79441 [Trichonephila clavipes]